MFVPTGNSTETKTNQKKSPPTRKKSQLALPKCQTKQQQKAKNAAMISTNREQKGSVAGKYVYIRIKSAANKTKQKSKRKSSIIAHV